MKFNLRESIFIKKVNIKSRSIRDVNVWRYSIHFAFSCINIFRVETKKTLWRLHADGQTQARLIKRLSELSVLSKIIATYATYWTASKYFIDTVLHTNRIVRYEYDRIFWIEWRNTLFRVFSFESNQIVFICVMYIR